MKSGSTLAQSKTAALRVEVPASKGRHLRAGEGPRPCRGLTKCLLRSTMGWAGSWEVSGHPSLEGRGSGPGNGGACVPSPLGAQPGRPQERQAARRDCCERPSAVRTGLPGMLASARPAGCSARSRPPLPGLPALPFTFSQTPADRAAQEIFTLVLRRLLVSLLFLIPRIHSTFSDEVRSFTGSV